MRTRLGFFLLIVMVGLFGISSDRVEAQDAAGIGIRPAVIEGPAEPGVPQQHDVTISNLSNSQQTYFLFVRDISGVTGAGAPIFASDDIEKTGFEMSEWITLGTTEIDLAPQQSQTVQVTIDVPEEATPGSHFAGVFVSLNPPRMRQTGASVGYDVANIVSLRVAGDVTEKASIRQFSTGNYIYGDASIDFQARVENEGNVLVRPVGPLEIHNMFGTRVAMLTFNESQAGVFPGVTRDFNIVWENDGLGFGRYEATLSLAYGQQGAISSISSNVTFWILPRDIIVPALLVLGGLLLTTYIAVRLYVRSKLQHVSGGSRRLVRQRRTNTGIPLSMLLLISMLVVTTIFLLILLVLFA